MNDPQPIATAPKDGTVILTDCGCAMFIDQAYWGPRSGKGKWAECSPWGDPDHCADDGTIYCSPKLWVPLPEWMK